MDAIVMDQKLVSDLEELRQKFTETRELYREVCGLLFFRYGITPTTNKLYQLVRKGSMSVPGEVLANFWQELRNRSRIQIDHPGLPEDLKELAGQVVSEIWGKAVPLAQINFEASIAENNKKLEESLQRCRQLEDRDHRQLDEIKNLQRELTQAQETLQITEKSMQVDKAALATNEKSLKSLQIERDRLNESLERAHIRFSQDIDKLNVALLKAEERYKGLETKALLEVDRERQKVLSLSKDVVTLKNEIKSLQNQKLKELTSYHTARSATLEKIGQLKPL